MMLQRLKLLALTIALIAAVSTSHAATTTLNAGTQTTPTVFSTSNDVFNISGSSVISSTGSSAAVVSSTGRFVLATSSTAVMKSNASVGTLSLAAGHGVTAGITVYNSGSLINTNAGGAAISLTVMNADGNAVSGTILNTGTISGSINFGAAATGNTLTNTSGTINGTVNGSTGVETITLNGNGTINGNIVLGAGNNVLIINSSTLAGNTTSGAGTDTLTLTNAIVSGTLTDTGTSDDDVLAISGTSFTTRGAISGYEIANISASTVNVSHGIAGLSTLRVASNSTINVSQSFALAAGSTLLNSGTLHIGAGKTVSAAEANFTAGFLMFDVGTSSTAGKLIVGSDANGMGATSYTVNLAPTAGFIASGTTFTLVDGSATATLGTLGTSNTAVYRYALSLADTNRDVVLTVGRVSTSSLVSSTDAKKVADVLDTLGASASNTLYTLQSNIGSAATAAEVDRIVESLAPTLDGVGAATVGVNQATGNQISARLASLRNTPYRGMAAGDGVANNHVWVQGFGTAQSQDSDSGTPGYDSTAGGVSLGLDADTIVDGMTMGVAFSYGLGSVESDAASNGKTDMATYAGTLYGSYMYPAGTFVNTQLGLGYNDYDSTRTVIGIGTAKGSTKGYQGSLKMETGRDLVYGNLIATPVAGFAYTHLNVDSYTETGAGGASLYVKPEAMDTLALSAGGQLAYAAPMDNGGTLKPAIRAKYVYYAGDTGLTATSHFTGGGTSFVSKGARADRSAAELGAGLTMTTVGGVDLSLDYDADLRSSLVGHTGQLKARWAF